MSGPRTSGWRQLLLDLAVIGCTILLFALFLEGVTRLIFAHSRDFSMEMWKYAAQLKRSSADPEAGFVHVPNRSAFLMGAAVSINSLGLRDREFAKEKPPGTCRVLMLGDSTTFGWGVPLEQTVAKILERKLNASSVPGCERFEVLNGGVGNYNTVQEVAQYRNRDRFFHPDLVILEYFINDAEPVPRAETPGLMGHSYLLALVVSRYDALQRFSGARPAWKDYYASLYRDNPPGLQAAKRALDQLADMTAQDGARLLVALLPELHQIESSYPFVREHQIIKDALSRKGVPAVELIDALRGHGPESSLWVTPQDPHPNGKANDLIASHLLRSVLRWDRLRSENGISLRNLAVSQSPQKTVAAARHRHGAGVRRTAVGGGEFRVGAVCLRPVLKTLPVRVSVPSPRNPCHQSRSC